MVGGGFIIPLILFSFLCFIHTNYADQIMATQIGGMTRRSSHEPRYKIEFHLEDSLYLPDDDEEYVFMPNTNGKNYQCFLPKVEKAKTINPVAQHNSSSIIMESEKHVKPKTPDELLQVMEDHCFLRQESWWTYEFCHKKHMRQFHLEHNKVVEEYFLGYYDPEATAAYNQNISDVSILKDPRSKDASQRYHAHQFTNGTNCDLTNQPRETEVRFVCSEGRAVIASITELSTCKYALTVHSPTLCTHPVFQVEWPVWHTIHCNVLREDSKEVKDDEHKNKRIRMVRDFNYLFNSNADEDAA